MKGLYKGLIVIYFLGISHQIYSQKNTADYIVIDSTYSMGKVSLRGKSKIQFQKSKNDQPVIYDANKVKEFGFDGWVYESFKINDNQLFFKRLSKGRVQLYQSKNVYLLKSDTSLLTLNKENYRSVVSQTIKCELDKSSLSKLSYSNTAMKNYFDVYNSGSCNLTNFPHNKLGIYAGYSFSQFNINFENSLSMADNIEYPTVGIFYDMPFYKPKSLFVSIDLNLLLANPLFYSENQNTTHFLGLDVRGANAMLSAKWLFNTNRIKPYIKSGAVVSAVAISSSSYLVETTSSASSIEVSRTEIPDSNGFMYGFNSSVGVEIPFYGRKNFHFELRYQSAFDGIFGSYRMNFSGYSINTGFNF